MIIVNIMKNKTKDITIFWCFVLAFIPFSYGQQSNYDVTAGDGNGLRFWGGNDSYKVHMGNTGEYHYGPVTDYSIKMNMNETAGRGWTWGHGA